MAPVVLDAHASTTSNPATAGHPRAVYLTVDVEPDCPPYLWTWRGIEEGLPQILELFEQEDVPATFFATGQVAAEHPRSIVSIVERGHELGCHGYSHRSFSDMDEYEARGEIERTGQLLRTFASVTSFRAPYLSLPEHFLPLLAANGYTVDSSRAAYKKQAGPRVQLGAPARLDASVSPSVIRLPRLIRDPWLMVLKCPLTLFVHPWEFVDFRASNLRFDCRFRTGLPALKTLRSAIRLCKALGYSFHRVREFGAPDATRA
jgi:peptidoglycan/xylan/chitin deacetylase (PgdA/CDA1 family)